MKVYIDGENFRKSLEKVLLENGVLKRGQQLERYNVAGLLRDVLAVDELDIVYYASRVKLPVGYKPSARIQKIADSVKSQARVWLANIVSQDIKLLKAGNLKIKESKPCYNCHKKQEVLQEKGVDVRLAVDLLEDVYEKNIPVIGVFSSDTDLCPALHKAVNKKVKVVYICFASGVNRAVAAVADETVTISAEKVKKYYGGKK
jgi:uncharacterized LabA/DUF88 family protein